MFSSKVYLWRWKSSIAARISASASWSPLKLLLAKDVTHLFTIFDSCVERMDCNLVVLCKGGIDHFTMAPRWVPIVLIKMYNKDNPVFGGLYVMFLCC